MNPGERASCRSESVFQILLVCSGNVCRSPFAAFMLRAAVADRRDVDIASAGTLGVVGQPVPSQMREVALRHGIPARIVDEHTSRGLSTDDVARADLVLGLTRQHRGAAVELYPRAVHYSFTLTEFARLVDGATHPADGRTLVELVRDAALRRGSTGGTQSTEASRNDIEDPMGGGAEAYQRAGREIANAVRVIGVRLRACLPAPARPSAGQAGRTTTPIDLSFSFPRL